MWLSTATCAVLGELRLLSEELFSHDSLLMKLLGFEPTGGVNGSTRPFGPRDESGHRPRRHDPVDLSLGHGTITKRADMMH